MRLLSGRSCLVAWLGSVALLAAACADGGGDYPVGGSNEGGAGAAGGAGGDLAGGGQGGEGGAEPDPIYCTPADGEEVDATCGIFVDASAPEGGEGTPDSPVRSVSEALEKVLPSGPRIYVCKSTIVEEAIDLPAGLDLHGGLDCTTQWRWNLSGRSNWVAPADSISLTTHGVTSEDDPIPTISGFHIEAPHATVAGGSSIAAVLDGGYLHFERMAFIGRDAMPGTPINPGQNANGAPGVAGSDAVGATGGPKGVSTCGSDGGNGGSYSIAAFPGGEGEPDQMNGGTTTGTTPNFVCTPGGNGASSLNGETGEDGIGLGTISVTGYTGMDGTPGTSGTNGGGGGGGGSRYQAGGGGGGSGGCGGEGGVQGTAGGSTIALIVLDAHPSFTDVSLGVGQAGNGGFGWLGGTGGLPSSGGNGTGVNGCDGGDGAQGGNGGAGGNGAGGHAILIAYTGEAPPEEGLTFTAPELLQTGVGPDVASDGVAGVAISFDPAQP